MLRDLLGKEKKTLSKTLSHLAPWKQLQLHPMEGLQEHHPSCTDSLRGAAAHPGAASPSTAPAWDTVPHWVPGSTLPPIPLQGFTS